MCGLIGLISRKGRPVGQQVFNLYKAQATRGKEGFGFLAIDGNWRLRSVNRSKDEQGIKTLLMKETAEIVMFHHRMPTSTKNTLGTTHPIFVSNKELKHDFYVAHNGVITNKDSMKTKHNELGYEYTTEFTEMHSAVYQDGKTEELGGNNTSVFNDSEALAIELARHIDGLSNTISTMGAAAFWVVALTKGTNEVEAIYFGKNNGRELKFTRNKKYHGISSSTGNELGAMELFSYSKGDPQLYTQELPIDEWTTTTKRVGYGAQQLLPPAREEPSTSSIFSSMSAYNDLENKHYTYSEALDTGIPLSEFIFLREYGYATYVPQKFAGMQNNRKAPSSHIAGVDEPPEEIELVLAYDSVSEKVKQQLEDLCIKFVTVETERDKLEESYSSGFVTEADFDREDRALEMRQHELEEKISSLNVPDTLQDEVLGLCRQMEDYNNNYSAEHYLQTS